MRSPPTRLFARLALLVAVASWGCSASPEVGGGTQTNGGEINAPPAVVGGSEGDTGDDSSDGTLVGVDDSTVSDVPSGLAVNAAMRATANVNLRKDASATSPILAVIPSGALVTLLDPTPNNGFLNVGFNGNAGWCSGTYLAQVASTSTGGGTPGDGSIDVNGKPSPDNAIARAKLAVGFSYYWGGGAWLAGGVSSGSAGSCSGSCPSCSHTGTYGADCSGLVAKAWQFGSAALEVNSHPYSTASFVGASSSWSTVDRAALQKGDALVYNSNGHGHVVLYEKGDGWGTPTVIECRGCAYGCVYNARSFTSEYKGIRRAGF